MEPIFCKSSNIHAVTVLEEFFFYYSLPAAIRDVEYLLQFASSGRIYDKRSPVTMIWLGDWLKKVIPACGVLGEACRFEALLMVDLQEGQQPDLKKKADFMWYPESEKLWEHLPRTLSAAAYADPLKALLKIYEYRAAEEWIVIINELVEFSLCREAIDDDYPGFNLLKLRKKLLCCVEAAYLVVVRYRQLKARESALATVNTACPQTENINTH